MKLSKQACTPSLQRTAGSRPVRSSFPPVPPAALLPSWVPAFSARYYPLYLLVFPLSPPLPRLLFRFFLTFAFPLFRPVPLLCPVSDIPPRNPAVLSLADLHSSIPLYVAPPRPLSPFLTANGSHRTVTNFPLRFSNANMAVVNKTLGRATAILRLSIANCTSGNYLVSIFPL